MHRSVLSPETTPSSLCIPIRNIKPSKYDENIVNYAKWFCVDGHTLKLNTKYIVWDIPPQSFYIRIARLKSQKTNLLLISEQNLNRSQVKMPWYFWNLTVTRRKMDENLIQSYHSITFLLDILIIQGRMNLRSFIFFISFSLKSL